MTHIWARSSSWVALFPALALVAMWLSTAAVSCKDRKGGNSGQRQRAVVRRHTPRSREPCSSLTSEMFKDGTFLKNYAHACVSKGVSMRGSPEQETHRTLRIGSLCTGSCIDAIAMDALTSGLAEEGIDVTFESAFLVEKDNDKRAFCMNVHSALGCSVSPCAFEDVATFCQPEGRYCAHHQKACELPRRLDGLIAGFSCKDFSRANKARKLFHGADVFTAEHSPGQSADTIRGLLQVLDTCPPDFFLLENVDDLAMELHGEALDMLLSAGSHRGYDCHSYILDAADFGLAQSRRRLFILGMLRPGRGFKIRDYTRFFSQVTELLQAFRISGPSLDAVLLEEEDEQIQQELARRQQLKQKGWDSSTIDVHRQAWASKGLRWQAAKASPADVRSPWFEALPLRERDVVAFHQHTHKSRALTSATLEEKKASLAPLCACDVSQSIYRASHSCLGPDDRLVSCTVLPGSKIFLSIETGNELACERNVHRLLHGSEALNLIGWPVRDPRLSPLVASHTSKFLTNLGGNAFASPIIVAFVCAMLFSVDELTVDRQSGDAAEGPAPERAEVDEAIRLYQCINSLRIVED